MKTTTKARRFKFPSKLQIKDLYFSKYATKSGVQPALRAVCIEYITLWNKPQCHRRSSCSKSLWVYTGVFCSHKKLATWLRLLSSLNTEKENYFLLTNCATFIKPYLLREKFETDMFWWWLKFPYRCSRLQTQWYFTQGLRMKATKNGHSKTTVQWMHTFCFLTTPGLTNYSKCLILN